MISPTFKIALGVCAIAVPSVQRQSKQDGDNGIDIRRRKPALRPGLRRCDRRLGPWLALPRDLQKPVGDSNERRLAEAFRSIEAAVALAAKLPQPRSGSRHDSALVVGLP